MFFKARETIIDPIPLFPKMFFSPTSNVLYSHSCTLKVVLRDTLKLHLKNNHLELSILSNPFSPNLIF